jgi:hypothetical protein
MSSMKARALLIAVSLLLAGAPAFAQKDEPLPPGQSDNETPPLTTAPHSPSAAPLPAYVDPTTPAAKPSSKSFDPMDWKNAIAVYGRFMFVTNLMLKPYLAASTQMNTWALGLQYIRRYEHFDVVTSVDFSWMQVDNGNFLSRSNINTADVDTHYVQFDKLSMISADVAIVGHHAFNNWLELRGGAGLGIGAVLGSVYTTNDSNQVCNKQTASHESQCYPISPTVGPIYLNQKDTNAKLNQTTDSSKLDTAQDPHRNKAFVPPAMGVLDVFMALNFRMQRHLSAQVELGFRDAMFVGLNLQSHF